MISVTILTKNSQKFLSEVLSSLQEFDEVVIYDNGSTDATLEIARKFSNVTIHIGPFTGFGSTHNQATSLAKNDWILSVDSDEIVTKEMVDEIKSIKLDSSCVYSFSRKNYFNGKFIKWCGWYPDRQWRLYNRKQTLFSDAQVHEGIIITNMKAVQLKSSIIHYSYSSISEFLSKMQLYTDLFAIENKGKMKSSIFKAITHGIYNFFKTYILKRGFLGGYEGLVISLYVGHTAYYKYLKLYEANCAAMRRCPAENGSLDKSSIECQ